MGTTLLLAATAGFLFVVNARRALRFPPLLVPAFFASWLVIELAPQLLLLDLTGTLYLAYRGALETWQGWVGAGVAGVSAFLLWGLVAESWESKAVIEDALTGTIGEAAAHRPLRWREFAFPFKLWSRKIQRVRNIAYATPGTRRYRLDVWRNREEGDARPCFLYVPGGAWTVGISNKDQQGKPLLIEMASQGFVCFAINYPLSPRSRFPSHIVAVKRAIAWIRLHAHEYGGDPRFLMISGNSAGGHLSSLAALTPNDAEYQPGFEDADTTIQAAAPLYGIYDLTGAQLEELSPSVRRHKRGAIRHFELLIAGKRLRKVPEFFSKASPWHRVGDHAPPFFVIHGAMDSLAIVEEARGFVDRLKAVSQQPVVYAELPRAQHAFDQFLSIRTLNAVRGIARFGRWAYERWTSTSDARPAQQRDQAPRSPTSSS